MILDIECFLSSFLYFLTNTIFEHHFLFMFSFSQPVNDSPFLFFVIYSLFHSVNYTKIPVHRFVLLSYVSFDSAFSTNKQFQSILFCYAITFAYCLAFSSLVLGLIWTNLLICVKKMEKERLEKLKQKKEKEKAEKAKENGDKVWSLHLVCDKLLIFGRYVIVLVFYVV